MTVITWIVEGTWPACVDAARRLAPADADIVLLHVSDREAPAAAHGAYAGLLGRGRPDRDPGRMVEEAAAASARELLEAAARRLGRPGRPVERRGAVAREVVAAAEGADLLIVARDGDLRRLGPKSLGPASRFVVDHAPCPVLLVWPGEAPDTGTIPPPPGGAVGQAPGPGGIPAPPSGSPPPEDPPPHHPRRRGHPPRPRKPRH